MILGQDDFHVFQLIKARGRTETGDIAKFLKQLPNLKGVSIEYTISPLRDILVLGALGNVISAKFQWHQLRELSLDSISTERKELFAVFQLHSKTLRTSAYATAVSTLHRGPVCSRR